MIASLARQEKWGIPLLLGFLFLLNLLIASRSPFGGWMDEVVFVDPAWNLANGNGWTSTIWWQTAHEFWAVNSPLYSGGLFVWIEIFGKSMIAMRAYCYFLATVGLFLLWLGTFRFNLLTPSYRLFWIVLLSTEYAMNWMERNERYDVWIFLALSLAWFGASLHSTRTRRIVVFAGCFLVPWGGFVGAPYVILMACLLSLLTGFRFWIEAIIATGGAISGVFSVFLFYWSFGHLQAFLSSLHNNTVADGNRFSFVNLIKLPLYPLDDLTLVMMIGVLGVLTLFFLFFKSPNKAAPWLFLAWAVLILMPIIMILRGLFVMMYFYMIIIPVSLAIFQLIREAQANKSGYRLSWVLLFVMGLTCLGGLPARLYAAITQWDFRDPQHMQDFVHQYVQPGDAVLSDYPFYFVLHDYVKYVASIHYFKIIPGDEASRVNVALIEGTPEEVFSQNVEMKGGWKKVAVFPTAEMVAHLKPTTTYTTYILYRREVPNAY